jgi:hypothetical protein
MSRYEELCRAYSAQGEAEHNYWQALQLRAAQIASGLWTYLDYPSQTYKDIDQAGSVPYVLLTQPGEEKKTHFTHLPGSNSAIQFDLVITLEQEPNLFPKSKVRFALNIGSTGEVLRVWDSSKTIDVEVAIGSEENEEVYAQIFEGLKKHLAYRTVLE